MEFLFANIKPLFQIIVLAIGFILSMWGLNRARWTILAAGISLIFTVFISTIYENPQFGIMISSLSTITLAIVAIFSFRESMQLRKQSQEREERDRKEHLLSEIIRWATDIVQCETSAPLTPLPVTELAKSAKELGKKMAETIIIARDRNIRTNLIMRYQSLGIMRERMVLMAKKLDKQFGCSIGDLAQETAKKLEAHIDLGRQFITEEITDDEYKEYWQSLVDSANSLAEEAEKAGD